MDYSSQTFFSSLLVSNDFITFLDNFDISVEEFALLAESVCSKTQLSGTSQDLFSRLSNTGERIDSMSDAKIMTSHEDEISFDKENCFTISTLDSITSASLPHNSLPRE